ncbi:hypothetical protein F5Y14DRAFT_368326 [Nemania sp. NC0429]|nr:hypothetical protein F5Y14DRAFT_368326 [Nemania sp. NC0429]
MGTVNGLTRYTTYTYLSRYLHLLSTLTNVGFLEDDLSRWLSCFAYAFSVARITISFLNWLLFTYSTHPFSCN